MGRDGKWREAKQFREGERRDMRTTCLQSLSTWHMFWFHSCLIFLRGGTANFEERGSERN